MRWMHALRLYLLSALLVLGGGVSFGKQPASGEPTFFSAIKVDQLPPEARQTLVLIQRGGPFPYRRDGVEFQNRERRLPPQTSGYYREYTVPTPGSHDRGPRRLIAGQQRDYYYTENHYRSFLRVLP